MLSKVSDSRKKLVLTLEEELQKWAKKNNKSSMWFRFAKKTKRGYRFLANKETVWKVLEEIGKRASKKHPEIQNGKIMDILSDYVNK